MITGSIKMYKEPVKYKAPANDNPQWGWMYENFDDMSMMNPMSWQAKDNMLLAQVNAATIKGFTVGTRVKRASGNPGFGTITHIHRSWTMAYNESTKEIEPFKVVWDKTGPHVGGTFDYCLDDIVLADEKKLPALLEQTRNPQTNETTLHLC